jgi:hypothetical protein
MVRFPIIILLLFLSFSLPGQNPIGTWSSHLSYYSAGSLAFGAGKVYASTGSSVMIFDKKYNELSKITRVQGLSETSISTIAWSVEQNTLIVAYSTTNIDLIKDNTVYNIPDIKRKYIPGNKQINRIKTKGKYAYLAGSFGIVVIDMIKNEVYDTWKPGTGNGTPEVYDIYIDNNVIYAATGAGVFSADISNPGLSYYGNWALMTSLPSPSGNYNCVIVSGNKIYVNHKDIYSGGDSVFVVDPGNGASLFLFQPGVSNFSLDNFPGGFSVSSGGEMRLFYEDGTLERTITTYTPDIPGYPDMHQSIKDGDDVWIADFAFGLIRFRNMTSFERLALPGPFTDNAISITCSGGKTFITGGAVDNAWNNQWRFFQVFIYADNRWYSEISWEFHDAMRVLPDPENPDHYWVSTWGEGLLEYLNNTLVNKYDDSNSPLQTIIPGKPYSRICGLAMDNKRNIWITQTGIPGSIKVLKSDGSWITNPVTIEAPTIGDMIISKYGYKWVVLPRGYGLYVLDDNNTPDNFTDDRYRQFLVKDNDNKVISNVYSIAEDLDGNIWVGTDQGPAIYYNPRQIFDEDPRAFRIKVPRNDGTGLADYMLGTEMITSIAIDGANRKWLGTYSSGAYLLSSDGTTRLVNYNEDNSPLLSNIVVSIGVDDKTGEVWFGTALGLISVRGDATAGAEELKDVYTFPNPVRNNYQGNITITGLMRNTQIRITDISGNLVYQAVSDGGQATWDLKTYNGKRVSTGVYLIFCSSEDGSDSRVAKMLVIK